MYNNNYVRIKYYYVQYINVHFLFTLHFIQNHHTIPEGSKKEKSYTLRTKCEAGEAMLMKNNYILLF